MANPNEPSAVATPILQPGRTSAAPTVAEGLADEIEWSEELACYAEIFILEGALLETLAHLVDDKAVRERFAEPDLAGRAIPFGNRIIRHRFQIAKWTTLHGGGLVEHASTSLHALEAKRCWLEQEWLAISRPLLGDPSMRRHLAMEGLLQRVEVLHGAVLLRRARATDTALEVLRAITAPPVKAGEG